MTGEPRDFSARCRVGYRQMRALLVKELQQLVRDRLLLGFVIYIFTLHIVVSTLGMSMDLRRSPTLVRDLDHSAAARDLIYTLRAPYFSVTSQALSARQGLQALDQGSARTLLEIPADFERTMLRAERPARVQLLVDGSKVALGFLAASYSTRLVQRFAAERSSLQLSRYGIAPGSLPVLENRQRTWFNFALDDAWPGSLTVLLTMMTIACVVLPAAAAVREKERGTIEQLLVSPLTPLQLMVAKTASMVLVTLVGTTLSLLLVLWPIFGVPMRGSLTLFLSMVALYAFTNAGLGLALATLARSSGQVGLLVILAVMPMIQLSGTFSPVESMPLALQYAMSFSPLYHFVRICYGVAFRGEGWLDLLRPMLAMSALGSALFALGLWRFKRQFS